MSNDAKCRWRSDWLDGAVSFRELLGQKRVMQIRQGETLSHQGAITHEVCCSSAQWWKYARLREICLNASVYNAMKYLQVQFRLSSVQCSAVQWSSKSWKIKIISWSTNIWICASLKTARPSRIVRTIDKEIKPVILSLEKVRYFFYNLIFKSAL